MKIMKTFGPLVSMQHLQTLVLQMSRAFQGLISFGTTFAPDTFSLSYGATPTGNMDHDINIKHYKASGTTPGTPNTTFTITSTGGFFQDQHVPIGFFVASVDNAAIIYSVTIGAWTNKSISLACNVASVNYRIIII